MLGVTNLFLYCKYKKSNFILIYLETKIKYILKININQSQLHIGGKHQHGCTEKNVKKSKIDDF